MDFIKEDIFAAEGIWEEEGFLLIFGILSGRQERKKGDSVIGLSSISLARERSKHLSLFSRRA